VEGGEPKMDIPEDDVLHVLAARISARAALVVAVIAATSSILAAVIVTIGEDPPTVPSRIVCVSDADSGSLPQEINHTGDRNLDQKLEILRRDLEVDGANSIAVIDIRRRVELAAHEVERLAVKVNSLRWQIEGFWTDHVNHLAMEHEQRLHLLFPEGTALEYRAAFERMTGYREVNEAFYRLIFSLRTVLPDYPSAVFA
jgi:hypothetical protein